jgi:hypothetical protein
VRVGDEQEARRHASPTASVTGCRRIVRSFAGSVRRMSLR